MKKAMASAGALATGPKESGWLSQGCFEASDS